MKQVASLGPKFEPCDACSGGFIVDKDGYATRCWCWKSHVDRWIAFVRQHKSDAVKLTTPDQRHTRRGK